VGAFAATLPLGIMLFSMTTINEIPDYQEDRLAGKLTLVARYGKKAGVKLYLASWVCTYSVIAIAAFFNVIPLMTLLALFSLPFAYNPIQTLRKNYENPQAIAPANLSMIKAHAITSFGLIIGYAVWGLTNRANQIQLLIIFVLLAVFYVPATFTLIKSRNPFKRQA
jgi:1,4-dihydroxy-2-naphthoate octaprenyltransferase